MSKRPATETLQEPSNTTAGRSGIPRASKRVKFDNSPPATHYFHDNAPAPESSTSAASTRRRKRAVSEGPSEALGHPDTTLSPYKRLKLSEDARQHDLDKAPAPSAATSNTSTWDRDCEAAACIMESVMKLSEGDKAVNDALFGYEIVDTTKEGTEPYGSVEWRFEQLGFKELQFDAIRLLIDPEKRHHPEIGLRGCLSTPVRYWAKRLEANRLIRLGLPPWHLESWGEVCGFRVPGRYIRPPNGHPPAIPVEYCEKHVSTIAALLRERETEEKWRRQSDIMTQLLKEVGWLKARDKAIDESLGIEHQQITDISLETTAGPKSTYEAPAPDPTGQQQEKKKRKKKKPRAKDNQQTVRRSTRRTAADETWELDSRGKARRVKRG